MISYNGKECKSNKVLPNNLFSTYCERSKIDENGRKTNMFDGKVSSSIGATEVSEFDTNRNILKIIVLNIETMIRIQTTHDKFQFVLSEIYVSNCAVYAITVTIMTYKFI